MGVKSVGEWGVECWVFCVERVVRKIWNEGAEHRARSPVYHATSSVFRDPR